MYCGSSCLNQENFGLRSYWNISQKHQGRLMVAFVVTEEIALNFEVSSCDMIFYENSVQREMLMVKTYQQKAIVLNQILY